MPETLPQKDAPSKPSRTIGVVLGVLVLLLAGVYTSAVLAGLRPERRIDGATLGIIGLAVLIVTVLFRPDILERVTHLEMLGWKVDIEKKQQQHDKQLQDIELILAILLTEAEQKHLLNLGDKKTSNYQGSHVLRSELRRLVDMHLIGRRTNRKIADITDPVTVDLGDFVKLTPTGERLTERIRQINAEREAEKAQA